MIVGLVEKGAVIQTKSLKSVKRVQLGADRMTRYVPYEKTIKSI